MKHVTRGLPIALVILYLYHHITTKGIRSIPTNKNNLAIDLQIDTHFQENNIHLKEKFCKMHLYNVSSVLRPRYSLMNVLARSYMNMYFELLATFPIFLNQIYNYNWIFFPRLRWLELNNYRLEELWEHNTFFFSK